MATVFEFNAGLNGVGVQSKENQYFDLNIGLNGASTSISVETYFNLVLGFNSPAISNTNVSIWRFKDELGQDYTGSGIMTIQSTEGTYSLPVTGNFLLLYPYVDSNLNIVQHTLTFVSDDGDWSTVLTLIPTPAEYTMQLYLSGERENFQLASFGAWNRPITQGEIINLHNNGGWNNPWDNLPVYYDRNMKKGLQHWLQFQDGSFPTANTVENWTGGADGLISGYGTIEAIGDNVISKANID